MDDKIVNFLKDALIKRQNEIQHTIEMMKKNKTAEQNKYSPTELSNYDNHPGDMGTELYQVQFNTALKVHEEHELQDIEDALIKIYDGSYGKCEFCGKEIDIERLKAIPSAKLCINCEESKAVTLGMLKSERPNEELVWDAPFGRKYLNKREDDENEGLDYLNDLVKYGTADGPQDMGGYYDYEEFYTNEMDTQGIVDKMDRISNEQYKRQLPD
ncbi:MAG TPA: TraR/DksA C4-type zinc finger protein [Pseudobacteroides sp.]|nr:TraR/DksA C4-type zinc finger protein [Pseudobacteroides sp.]